MLGNTLEFFAILPIAMVIIFCVSLPIFFLMLGWENDTKQNNAEFAITIILFILAFIWWVY